MSEEREEYTTSDVRDTADHIRRGLHSGIVPLNVSLADAVELMVIVTERLELVIDSMNGAVARYEAAVDAVMKARQATTFHTVAGDTVVVDPTKARPANGKQQQHQ